MFHSNPHNRYSLYQVFYPQNQHLPYAVDINYQTVQPNGDKTQIITLKTFDDYQCNVTSWRWISSTVFIFARPEYLNVVMLYTLNHFRVWITPTVTLTVPHPCPNDTLDFLTQMTSLVSSSIINLLIGIYTHCTCILLFTISLIPSTCMQADSYALKMVDEWHPSRSGNVVLKCQSEGAIGFQEEISQSQDTTFHKMTNIAFFVCVILGVSMLLIKTVLMLKWNLKYWVELSNTYSYRYYGLLWAMTSFTTFVVPILLYLDTTIVLASYPEYGEVVQYSTCILLLALAILPAIPISAYFAYKTKPPVIPYCLLVPVAIVFCCCNTRRAKSLVLSIAMWINIIAMEGVIFHGLIIIFLGILAEPFTVFTNVLILLLAIFCIINILALLFTISAYIFTPKHLRPQGQGKTMLHALLLIPLLAMVSCLCYAIGSVGYLLSGRGNQGNVISFVSSFAFPLILGSITFGLKVLITKWLDKLPKCKPLIEHSRDINVVHNEELNEPTI